jgi:hypothetical protein
MTGYRMTDPFGQVRSRVCQLAIMVSVTVMPVLLNPTLHLDNLDLSLSTNLSYTNKSATISEAWLNIINLCYDGFYRWFYLVAIIFQVCLTDQVARERVLFLLYICLTSCTVY